MESTSPSRRRDSTKTHHRHDFRGNMERGPSRKRRRITSSSTFPLTEHGVQMIVRGLAFAKPGELKDQKICVKKKNPQRSGNVVVTNADEDTRENRKDMFDEIEIPTVTEIILKLRMDQKDQKDAAAPILFGSVSDGKDAIRVVLPDLSGKLSRRMEKEKHRNKKYDWIISIKGYTTTEAVCNDKFFFTPYTYLTAVTVLSTIKRKATMGEPYPYSLLGSKRAHAGTTGSFLENFAPLLTNDELAGLFMIPAGHILGTSSSSGLSKCNQLAAKGTSRVLFPEASPSNLKTVQDFLSFSTAMNTIQQTSTSSSAPPEPQSPVETSIESNMFSPTKLPTHQAADLYSKAIEEFKTSQMDRQNASLGTNAGRESAEKAALIVQRYDAVLAVALKETRPLTTEMLCSWHRDLMEGVGDEGGDIRSRTVRCGKTVFCPPSEVRAQLDLLFRGLQVLKKRLDWNNPLHMVLYAVVAMYGVIDIHPFLDGNGRVSRIVANYALKEKLPFPVNLFATPAQRAEYIEAIEQTRHSLSIKIRGDVSTDESIYSLKHAGVFHSSMALLMDCIAKAAVECNRVWEEKSGLFAEAAEAKAARKHRERSAQGTCIICFDALPNILTLCCGKPIHLNCIAEWLGNQTTCPNCRAQMPAISGRVVRAARRTTDDEHTEADNASEALEVARQNIEDIRETRDLLARIYDQVSQRGIRRGAHSSEEGSFSGPSDIGDTTTTTTSDEDEDSFHDSEGESNDGESVEEFFQVASSSGANQNSTTTTSSESEVDAAHDTTTTMNGDSEDGQEYDGGDTTSTTADMEEDGGGDDTTATNPGGSSPRRSLAFCSGATCNNRAAVDCTNNLCGRCCVLGGEFHCARHNS